MKNLGILKKPIAAALVTAITAGMSPANASEEVRLPTAAEMIEIKAEYEKTFGLNLAHVRIFYNEPKLSHRGPVGSIRAEKLNACGVVVNSNDWKTISVLSFLKDAPDQETGRKFLVAHELTHCLFTRKDSMHNLKLLRVNVEGAAHSQETIADLVGAAFVIRQGGEAEKLLGWLREKRSGYFLNSHYNTAQYLNVETIKSIDEQIKTRGSTFTFFSDTKLFNVSQEPTRTATASIDPETEAETTVKPDSPTLQQKGAGLSM